MARKPLPASLRRLAKPTAALAVENTPPPKGKNPSARRVRRLARKGWLIGWPFSKGVL
ncbi:hypothetical protein [Paracoccus sp. N5]|uniref:hypothetical protein n=1 Tax=Paracoccus sp. N5 TaxID=1101189 RepID=UPI0003728A20|nr:hypothetical protein [Paracoccus sp. N5]